MMCLLKNIEINQIINDNMSLYNMLSMSICHFNWIAKSFSSIKPVWVNSKDLS